jgi:predicted outer membrane protein
MKMKYLLLTAIAALALLPSLGLAQEKGATKLMKVQTVQNLQQVEAGDTIVMSCPKCKDTFATVVTKPLKGMQPDQIKAVVKHLCPTCTTSIQTIGAGKHATDKLVHTCNSCGSPDVSCCLMQKDGGKTTGM